MTSNPAEAGQAAANRERVEIIRAAVASEIRPLWLAVAALVRSADGDRGGGSRNERVDEALNEAVSRALERPGSYEPGRPVVPWIVGIARNVLRGEARVGPGRVARADLDDAAWGRLLGVLGSSDGAAAARIDVEQMMRRLGPPARKAIECRFFRGLDGNELAEALGAPSAGAARVRVARALQTLRNLFAADASEVTP